MLIKVKIESAHQRLHEDLQGTPARHRAERLRYLAMLGLKMDRMLDQGAIPMTTANNLNNGQEEKQNTREGRQGPVGGEEAERIRQRLRKKLSF